MQLDGVRRVFVRAPNWVGDLVMATASFARIRAAFPAATITCGLRPYLRPLLDGETFFDRYLDSPHGGVGTLWQQVQALRAERVEVAIVLPNSLASGLAPFFARVPLRLGYRQGRPGLMTHGLTAERGRRWYQRSGPRRVPRPMPTYYRELLDVIGLPAGPELPRLVVTPSQRQQIDRWCSERGITAPSRLVLLNAGASFGASKLWDPERFAALARHLVSRGWNPVFLAGPAEVELVRPIAARAGVLAAIDPVLKLDVLKALVERAALMITTDTGPRHVAVALGIPVVCLIGPTDRRYTDYGLEQQIVIQKDLACSPCQRKVCPLGHHDCMRTITVEEVIAASEALLAARAGSR